MAIEAMWTVNQQMGSFCLSDKLKNLNGASTLDEDVVQRKRVTVENSLTYGSSGNASLSKSLSIKFH